VTGVAYFFDLPVYRLPGERYYVERGAFVDRHMQPIGHSQLDESFRGHLEYAYGGPWQFNEIIGYIRLFFLGSQVRGEYFGVQQKRIVRTRRKTMMLLELKLVPEMKIPPNATSAQIFTVISDYVQRCKNQLKKRIVDDSLLTKVGPFVDWKRLIASV
jgi:hypothetical protein